MKLYLSSYLMGDHPEQLLAMAGGAGARMAVITNALDAIPLESQLTYTQRRFDPESYFASFGFDPSLLDLRRYFGRTADLRTLFKRYQIIWAIGGNAFLLRRAMRDSGFDEIIDELLDAGTVYAGWSAGTCVAGASLKAIAPMDDSQAIGIGHEPGGPVFEGLGLLPYDVIPHCDSDHPEAALAAETAKIATDNNLNHVTLRDGEVIIRIGNDISILPCRP